MISWLSDCLRTIKIQILKTRTILFGSKTKNDYLLLWFSLTYHYPFCRGIFNCRWFPGSEFFDYLDFNLYPIQPPYSRLIKVECQNDGSSRLNINEISGFYEQIQRNTTYIIHPDEILADNFVFMVKATQDARVLGQFTEEGQELIEEMMEVIKKK